MKEFIFIAGGARSGKSRYAQDIARHMGGEVVFIATCEPNDDEMRQRVLLHKKSRPRHWETIEEQKDLVHALLKIRKEINTIIIDCLGLAVTNLLMDHISQQQIEDSMKSLAQKLKGARFNSIVVSNDVGCGIVPANPLARQFRDIVGNINQTMARYADRVIIMNVGIPTQVKGGKIGKVKKNTC